MNIKNHLALRLQMAALFRTFHLLSTVVHGECSFDRVAGVADGCDDDVEVSVTNASDFMRTVVFHLEDAASSSKADLITGGEKVAGTIFFVTPGGREEDDVYVPLLLESSSTAVDKVVRQNKAAQAWGDAMIDFLLHGKIPEPDQLKYRIS